MKKRLIGLLLIAVMLISIAAGCASGSKSEHSRDTAPASRSSTAGGVPPKAVHMVKMRQRRPQLMTADMIRRIRWPG